MTNIISKIQSLTDGSLLQETQKLVKEERELLSLILHHLLEIERRRLFAKLKYPSLFEYTVRELGYSEDQAYRRIQAMRLFKELPELEEKINKGSLSLTHLGMAQSLFKREEKSQKGFSKQVKLEILEKLENKSKREAEKITFFHSMAPVAPVEKVRAISQEDIEFKFTAKESLLKKINKLKALMAHKNPYMGMAELIDELCDLGLEKWDKSKSPAPARAAKRRNQAPSFAQIKREVWARDKGRCRKCGSQYALEIDHRLPRALGGQNAKENLRLLCRSCNQRAAIEVFGLRKMEGFVNA